MIDEPKLGRPRKYDYVGEKKNKTVRETEEETDLIMSKFSSRQEFYQWAIDLLKTEKCLSCENNKLNYSD